MTGKKLTVGSLAAGIGGFDLGLQRAGMEITWQVEIDPFCRRVLAKHWPDVKRYEDIRTLLGHQIEPVDLVCAGFPCQPVSLAGRRKAEQDERWIWPDIARVCREIGPRLRWIVLENVPGLLTAGSPTGSAFGEVLYSLADLGFSCEWDRLSAADCGAPHRRSRCFVVAYAEGARLPRGKRSERSGRAVVNRYGPAGSVSNAGGQRLEGLVEVGTTAGPVGRADRERGARSILAGPIGIKWPTESGLGRTVPYGISGGVVRNRRQRLMALGNSVLPYLTEWIGARIIDYERNAGDTVGSG